MLVARAEYNYYPEEVTEERAPNKKHKTNKKAHSRKRQRQKSKLRLFTLGFCIFTMAFGLFILFGYANISRVNFEINELQTIKNQLESEKSSLIADLEGIKATRKIADEAMYKLGMVYPKESQLVYISVNELNEPADEIMARNSIFGGINRVLGLFSSLF